MPVHDISLPISGAMVVWPGDPPVQMSCLSSLDAGDAFSVTRLDMGSHVGTHVDAPAHFLPGGKGVDELDLELLIGQALVVDVGDVDTITASTLAGLTVLPGTRRLLLRTRNSQLWVRGEKAFVPAFVAIEEDGARWLLQNGIRLVGIDYLSVAPYDNPVPSHEVLLGAGVIIVEGLDLSRVVPGTYQFVCLPLKLVGCDGSPARAVLVEVEGA
jgi:arylformamidase